MTSHFPYAIMGSGRVATHMIHYLNLLKIPFKQWSRKTHSQNDLPSLVKDCRIILILISDNAIEPFIKQHTCLSGKTLVHFSGALSTPLAYGAHPLTSLANTPPLDLKSYQSIPFIIEEEGPPFDTLLPHLQNTHYTLPKASKPLYHSLCVLSGNFTCILWNKFFSDLEQKFNIPQHASQSYFQQIVNNINHNHKSALTGPLIRNDTNTITANLDALQKDPFQKIYQAFVDCYQDYKNYENP